MAGNLKLADTVALHRRAAGLNRVELAMLAGVGKTVIFDIEHGKQSVRWDTVLKVLKSLNITLVFDSPLTRGKPNA